MLHTRTHTHTEHFFARNEFNTKWRHNGSEFKFGSIFNSGFHLPKCIHWNGKFIGNDASRRWFIKIFGEKYSARQFKLGTASPFPPTFLSKLTQSVSPVKLELVILVFRFLIPRIKWFLMEWKWFAYTWKWFIRLTSESGKNTGHFI